MHLHYTSQILINQRKIFIKRRNYNFLTFWNNIPLLFGVRFFALERTSRIYQINVQKNVENNLKKMLKSPLQTEKNVVQYVLD